MAHVLGGSGHLDSCRKRSRLDFHLVRIFARHSLIDVTRRTDIQATFLLRGQSWRIPISLNAPIRGMITLCLTHTLRPSNRQGSSYIYRTHLAPFFCDHERDIDAFLASLKGRASVALSGGVGYIWGLIRQQLNVSIEVPRSLTELMARVHSPTKGTTLLRQVMT